ncbi:MAG TPA: DUF4340 domain-containing protein [Gammaproteobacteria bacterium]|nr:DUF4340 domain-containing protein [Gammaproteobacteria bacterium]
MAKTIRVLALLLGGQLLAALGLSFTASDLAARPAAAPLLALDSAKVDRLVLTGSDGDSITLAKTSDGWRLSDQSGFPADGAKVDGLLARLTTLKHGPAVATSSAARPRFKVDDSSFERRIELAAGEQTLATLYLGTSPALRQTHARRAGDDAIYAVELASHDAPVTAEDWQDKGVLQFPATEVTAIRLPDLTLQRVPQQVDGNAGEALTTLIWQATPEQPLDQAAADTLTGKLANLRIGSVLGREAKAEYRLDQPLLTLTVERQDTEAREYRLAKLADESGYVLKVSNRPEYFRLPSYTGDGLVEATAREGLRAKPSEEADTDQPAGQPS